MRWLDWFTHVCAWLETRRPPLPPPPPLFRVCVLNCMRSLDARGKQADLSLSLRVLPSSSLFLTLFFHHHPLLPPSLLSFVSLPSRGRSVHLFFFFFFFFFASLLFSSPCFLASTSERLFFFPRFSLPIVSVPLWCVRVNLFSWPLETTLS